MEIENASEPGRKRLHLSVSQIPDVADLILPVDEDVGFGDNAVAKGNPRLLRRPAASPERSNSCKFFAARRPPAVERLHAFLQNDSGKMLADYGVAAFQNASDGQKLACGKMPERSSQVPRQFRRQPPSEQTPNSPCRNPQPSRHPPHGAKLARRARRL